MDAYEQEVAERLNKLYYTDPIKYLNYLSSIKDAGYKVYRNDNGKHKVKSNIYDAFGGIFGDIFGRTKE